MFRRMAQNLCRIQYASDLHLEHYDKMAFPRLITPSARILCLAGDIGNPRKQLYTSFLEYCQDKWDHVFIIAGNHEFYNRRPLKDLVKYNRKEVDSWDTRLELCRTVCSQWPNVHFLEKDSYYLRDYNLTVLGTTMWTHIPSSKAGIVKNAMNDYNYIAKGDAETIEPADVTEWHRSAKQWLEAKLFDAEEERHHALVMTHHMPSTRFIKSEYFNNEINCAFAAPMDKLLVPPVRAWIYGHTHDQKVTAILHGDPPDIDETTVCAVNAFGYNAREQANYTREAVIEIPCGPWKNPVELLA